MSDLLDEKTLTDLGLLIEDQQCIIDRQKIVINDLLALLRQHVSAAEMEQIEQRAS